MHVLWPVKSPPKGLTSFRRHHVAARTDASIRLPVQVRRWHARILRACLREPTGADARTLARAAPGAALESLPDSAALHRVVGPAHETIGEALPPEAARRLGALYREECARHLLVTANLRRVQALLEAMQIPFLVVKGPALEALAYRVPASASTKTSTSSCRRREFPAALEHSRRAVQNRRSELALPSRARRR